MTGAPVFSAPESLWMNRATYAQDGWVGMTLRAHLNFMVHAKYQCACVISSNLIILHWIMSQLSEYYGIEIDASQLMPAFSFLQDGQHV